MKSSLRGTGGSDLIVARATAPGRGAVAIVRIDGRGAAGLLRSIFRPAGKSDPVDDPRRMIFGRAVRPPGERPLVIDDVLAVFFPAPNSYTGNDLAEIHCHGGPAVVREILAAAMHGEGGGARAARPGEFTERAFLNGKLDLARAEAVADLIDAGTGTAARAARAQLAGGLSDRVRAARLRLIDLAAEIEARIDFPDEDTGEADADRMSGEFGVIGAELAALLDTRRRGRLLREGARIALVGPPNVGKSSLLNALARGDRAIVSPQPGTTRDTVECQLDLGGVPVTLIDTAGIRETDEPVERIGIERSRRAALDADRLIEVRDATSPAPFDAGRTPDLVVVNKADLIPPGGAVRDAGGGPGAATALLLSARTGEGIDALERALTGLVCGEGETEGAPDGIAINERHGGLLEASAGALRQAADRWNDGGAGGMAAAELVMIDLREAISALEELLGLNPDEAILDRVFEKFCMGK